MSSTPVPERARAYSRASASTLGLGVRSRVALWFHAVRDARRGLPSTEHGHPVFWESVPTWNVERANATKLARMTVLGLLIANRAELREYDALVSRRTLEAGLRASVELTDREVAPERFRRITRNLTSIERQLPGLASHLANANREASSWAELFFDAADHRLAYYWRVLRRKHPDGANLGDTPPTLPRPDWLIAVSLADLVDELDDENPEEDDDGSE